MSKRSSAGIEGSPVGREFWLRLVALGAACVSFPLSEASALPALGPAFETDPPVPVQNDTTAFDLAVASDGENLLSIFEEGGNIRGMLIDATGEPLFSQMAIYARADETSGNYYPALAFGGDRYLMAWTNGGIWAQFVGLDGEPVGEALQLSETGYSPALAWVSGGFVLVWMDFDGELRELAVAKLGPDGAVTGPELVSVGGTATDPSLASLAEGALVAWVTNTDAMNTGVQALLLDASGNPAGDAFSLTTEAGTANPEVASDGSGYLVAWTQTGSLQAVQVGAAGEVSSAQTVVEGESLGDLALGANADGYVVVVKDYSPEDHDDLLYRQLTSSGELGTAGTLVDYPTTANAMPALLGQGSGFFVVYQGEGIFGAFTDGALSPSTAPVPLSLVPHSQNTPTVTWDGSNYVVLWADEREGDLVFAGRAVRVDTAGQVLDEAPLMVTGEGDRGSWFSLASRGMGSSLIGWLGSESREIYARGLGSDGVLGTTHAAGVSANSGGNGLARSATGYLSVYAGTNAGEYWVREFDDAGAPQGEAMPLDVPEATNGVNVFAGHEAHLLVLDGAETQVAPYADGVIGQPLPLGVDASSVEAVVGAGKTVLVWADPDGARWGRFWTPSAWESDAFQLTTDGRWGQTVWSGSEFAAVWQDSEYYAYFATFDAQGNVTAPEPLFADEECNGPALASNGAGQYLLSCIRYTPDYARRLVNYLMGEMVPAAEPPAGEGGQPSASNGGAPPLEVDPQPEVEPEPTRPAPAGENTAGAGGQPATEPAVTSRGGAPGAPDPNDAPVSEVSDAGAVEAPPALDPARKRSGDEGGCHVNVAGARSGSGQSSSPWYLAGLGLAVVALRRRRGV